MVLTWVGKMPNIFNTMNTCHACDHCKIKLKRLKNGLKLIMAYTHSINYKKIPKMVVFRMKINFMLNTSLNTFTLWYQTVLACVVHFPELGKSKVGFPNS